MKYVIILIATLGFLNSSFGTISEKSTTVTGYVYDETGVGIIGANVLVKGTTIGTITDIDGKFSLQVPEQFKEIQVSYTGYSNETIRIDHSKAVHEVKISMQAGALLDEIVISHESSKGKKENRTTWRKRSHHNTRTDMKQSYSPPAVEVDRYRNEQYGEIQENRFINPLTEEALSTFSIDVDRASYSNVRRMIDNGQLPPKDAVRIEEMINYFDYQYAQPESKDPIALESNLMNCPWNNEHQLLHISLQGKDLDTKNLPASNLVFLVDVSGSMQSVKKLPLLKSSFKMLVNNLREKDKVAIVTYAGRAAVVLESTQASEKEKILNAIDNLRAGGSTAGAEGILTAYKIAKEQFIKKGNNRVILATDGDFNVGVSSDEGLEKLIEEERKSGIFLSVLGYGMGNYKDEKMQILADKGNGNHAYIDNIQEARKVFVNEFGGTLFTIAKDVKIQIEFNPAHVVAYRLIGYENRLLAKEDFNDDTKDAGEMGSGHVVTAIYEIVPIGSKSAYIGSVDPLKYQVQSKPAKTSFTGELATVKFRYKTPEGNKSKMIENKIKAKAQKMSSVSEDIRFSVAVAEFGMLLRDSDFKADASLENVITLAEQAKGKDKEGYRSEFIRLVKSVKELHGELATRD